MIKKHRISVAKVVTVVIKLKKSKNFDNFWNNFSQISNKKLEYFELNSTLDLLLLPDASSKLAVPMLGACLKLTVNFRKIG